MVASEKDDALCVVGLSKIVDCANVIAAIVERKKPLCDMDTKVRASDFRHVAGSLARGRS